MTIRNAIPTIWHAEFLLAVRDALVYGDVVNNDYEGDINQVGDSVKIITVGRPTVKKYIPNVTTIVPEKITTAEQFLTITEMDYVAIEIDDVDRRQAIPGLVEEAAKEAAYSMQEEADSFISSKYTEVAPDNNLGTMAVTTPEEAKDLFTELMVTLDNAKVPRANRWAVAPPFVHGLLTDVKEYVDLSNPAPGTDAVLNGLAGRLKGFDIRMATNTPNPTGDDFVIMAGTRAAISFANQIPLGTWEFYRPQSSFSDAMKALHVYGAKVVRPDHLAVAIASET